MLVGMWSVTQSSAYGLYRGAVDLHWLVVLLLLVTLLFSSLALAEKAGARQPGSPEKDSKDGSDQGVGAVLALEEVVPLPLYPRYGQEIWQTARVVLENRGDRTLEDLTLYIATSSGEEVTIPLRGVDPGRAVQTVELPGSFQGELLFTIKDRNGRLYVSRQMEWRPARKWEIHLVQHSHTDLGYTGTQAEVLQVHLDNIRDALEYARATNDWPEESRFRWNVEVAWSLSEYLARALSGGAAGAPDTPVASLKEMVQSGRIGIPGLFLNELYSLNGLEEMIRQVYPSLLEIGPRLGHQPLSAMLTDVPGAPWGLVPVLYQAGVRYLDLAPNDVRVTQTIVAPSLFWWEGPDGKSRILTMIHVDPPVFTYYEGNHWGLAGNIANAEVQLVERLMDLERRGYPYDLYEMRVQGVSDSPRYIDNTRPQLLTAILAREWNERYAYPRLVVSTGELFFTRLERLYGDALPVFRGDLTDWWVDGAASSAAETALARRTIDRLTAAETLASLAWALGLMPDVTNKLREAYRNLILYHEHTWGSDDPRPENPVEAEIWRVKAGFASTASRVTEEVLNRATAALAGITTGRASPCRSSPPGDAGPSPRDGREVSANTLIIFNSLAYDRTDVVESVLPEQWQDLEEGTKLEVNVRDLATGRTVPAQLERRDGEPARLVFVAENVPPMGYKAFAVEIRKTAAGAERGGAALVAENVLKNELENERFRIVLDPATGALASLYDKKLRKEWVNSNSGRGFNQYIYQLGGTEYPVAVTQIGPGVRGPVRSSLQVEVRTENAPRIVQEVYLYHFPTALEGRIEIVNTIVKQETRQTENAWYAFPVDVPGAVYRYEIPGASVRLYTDQLPGSALDFQAVLHWSDISNDEFGITMASPDVPVIYYGEPGKRSDRPRPGSLSRVGVELDPAFFLPDDPGFYPLLMTNRWTVNYRLSQGGVLTFRFGFEPHAGPFDSVAAERFGRSLATPLLGVWLADGSRVSGPPEVSFATVEPETVTVETVKVTEKRDGLLFRLQEIAGKPRLVRISLPLFRWIGASQGNVFAYRADLVERPLAELPVGWESGSPVVEVPVDPYEIATIVICLDQLVTGEESR